MTLGRRIRFEGVVQGVGFRPWVFRAAHESGVTGRVRNDANGVIVDAFGSLTELDRFACRLASPPAAAEICRVTTVPIPTEVLPNFSIVPSDGVGDRRVSIPADLAICDDCLREIFDPTNRRYRYALTNCTNCGPRFTIAHDVPYDRAATTMSAFVMCAQCRAEYHDPANRRFHAQPNACRVCGPTLSLVTADGQRIESNDPIRAAAAALCAGGSVAVKGLGGYHLACDATNDAAVQQLRRRKHRDEKPFAVMVRGLEHAEQLADLCDAERALLGSVERPIVIVRRRQNAKIADAVAPRSPLIGLMLAYTPLHHLLLNDADRPLVMTSANLAEEPLTYQDTEARLCLSPLADLLLQHDRPIETRCDDSVARVINGAPVLLRRSRGYVPRAITLRRPMRAPVLACGALLKNTFCLADRDRAVLGPHIGDLENLETYEWYDESVARMRRFLGVTPTIVAHDLHPDYLSTRYALELLELRQIGVQHHHAHIASAMAEHGLLDQVIGVAFDGTGYGTDGSSWGGEVMLATLEGFERIATLRPIPLPGGDVAIRQPWRIATALLDDAFAGRAPLDAFPVLQARPYREVSGIRLICAHRDLAPLAHGAGRYFDAVAALALNQPISHYEGQLALELNVLADPDERSRYEFAIDRRQTPWEIDLRPMVRSIAAQLIAGISAARVSARFHNTLVAATASAVRSAFRVHGRLPIVLTGGCFQNPRLAEGLVRELQRDTPVYLHRRVPPGDGGIALGQAVIADAIVRRDGE